MNTMQRNHKVVQVSEVAIAILRNNQLKEETEFGWGIIANINHFENVLLVSEFDQTVVVFDYGKPYHDFLRARCYAIHYAEENEKKPLCVKNKMSELVVQNLYLAS